MVGHGSVLRLLPTGALPVAIDTTLAGSALLAVDVGAEAAVVASAEGPFAGEDAAVVASLFAGPVKVLLPSSLDADVVSPDERVGAEVVKRDWIVVWIVARIIDPVPEVSVESLVVS